MIHFFAALPERCTASIIHKPFKTLVKAKAKNEFNIIHNRKQTKKNIMLSFSFFKKNLREQHKIVAFNVLLIYYCNRLPFDYVMNTEVANKIIKLIF
jgi:hypothetical protein